MTKDVKEIVDVILKNKSLSSIIEYVKRNIDVGIIYEGEKSNAHYSVSLTVDEETVNVLIKDNSTGGTIVDFNISSDDTVESAMERFAVNLNSVTENDIQGGQIITWT